MSTGYRSEQGLSPAQTIERGCRSDAIILACIMLINRRVIVVAIFKVIALVILSTVATISQRVLPCIISARISDGIFLYPYDNRMCYFDAVIEKF